MAERSGNTMKNLEESTEKLNRMAGEGREFMRILNQGDGSFRRLLEDPTLYNNLNDLLCTLARELPRIDRILRDVEVFADKIARHPESLGVRGAVAPGSGLKEAPAGASSRPRILPSR
jgi:phospholipid/cholesterol/gamma-HCH transport system substrate-binding protein